MRYTADHCLCGPIRAAVFRWIITLDPPMSRTTRHSARCAGAACRQATNAEHVTHIVVDRGIDVQLRIPHRHASRLASRCLLSPMPGLLVDIAAQSRQKAQAGERVAVIEAMKMEHVRFASADGVVAKVLASKGESLVVDQPIVEFE